ncbi:MAG: ABC transporter substrate-binding protein [Bdellovibrionales bacterium]
MALKVSILASALVLGSSVAGQAEPKMAAKEKDIKNAIPIKVCIPASREEYLTLEVIEAQDRGFFKEEGLAVELIPVREVSKEMVQTKAGPLPVKAVADRGVAKAVTEKKCEFGTSMVESLALPEAQNMLPKIRPMFIAMYGEGYDTHLVVPKDSPVKTVSDLKGKRVRVGQLPVYIAMHNMLKEAGLKNGDVKMDNLGNPARALAQMESGKIAAAVTYVPTMPYMLASGKVRILKSNIMKSYVAPAVPHSMVIASEEYAAASPEVLRKFAAAIRKSNDYFTRNPVEAIRVFQRHSADLLKFAEWKVDNVIVEKAASFVGKMQHMDLTAEGPQKDREQATKLVAQYLELIRDFGFTSVRTDLTPWLNWAQAQPPATAAKTQEKVSLLERRYQN